MIKIWVAVKRMRIADVRELSKVSYGIRSDAGVPVEVTEVESHVHKHGKRRAALGPRKRKRGNRRARPEALGRSEARDHDVNERSPRKKRRKGEGR